MKQYQTSFRNAEESTGSFHELRKRIDPGQESRMLFQVFCGSKDKDAADRIADELEKEFPGVIYAGCSTYGNIMHGDLCPDTYTAVCSVFESPSARIETRQYHLGKEAEEAMNISGMYFEWENEDDVKIGSCAGTIGQAKTGSEDYVELCQWYDADQGLQYSLSVYTTDVDGLDLAAVAEQVYKK